MVFTYLTSSGPSFSFFIFFCSIWTSYVYCFSRQADDSSRFAEGFSRQPKAPWLSYFSILLTAMCIGCWAFDRETAVFLWSWLMMPSKRRLSRLCTLSMIYALSFSNFCLFRIILTELLSVNAALIRLLDTESFISLLFSSLLGVRKLFTCEAETASGFNSTSISFCEPIFYCILKDF